MCMYACVFCTYAYLCLHLYLYGYLYECVSILFVLTFLFKLCIHAAFIVMPTVTLSLWLTVMGFQARSTFPTVPVMGFFEILLLVALPWSQMELSIKKAIRRLYIREIPCKANDRIIQHVAKDYLPPVLMWL